MSPFNKAGELQLVKAAERSLYDMSVIMADGNASPELRKSAWELWKKLAEDLDDQRLTTVDATTIHFIKNVRDLGGKISSAFEKGQP